MNYLAYVLVAIGAVPATCFLGMLAYEGYFAFSDWYRARKEDGELGSKYEQTPMSLAMQGLTAQLESDLYGAKDPTDVLDDYPEESTKPKWKIAYYNKISKRYGEITHYKTRTKEFDYNRIVQVFYEPKSAASYKAAEVVGDSELNMYISAGRTPEFVLPTHEALDLYVALKKYFELSGEDNLVKVRKQNV